MGRHLSKKIEACWLLALGLVMALSLVVAPKVAYAKTVNDPYQSNISTLKNNGKLVIRLDRFSSLNYGYRVFTCNYKKLKNVKVSNSNVLSAFVDKESSSRGTLLLMAHKAGKSKLTFTYDGKKRTVNVVVKKYTNPVATIKVGKKNLTSKYKRFPLYTKDVKKQNSLYKQKIDVTPKKGWKLKGIYAHTGYNSDSSTGGYKVVKNHGKLPKCSRVEVLFARTSGAEEVMITYAEYSNVY